MSYFGEIRANWRPLAAATLGIATGYSLNNYFNNVFIPALMQEFAWSSAQIALMGLAALTSIVCQPLAGRLADRFGVRPVASVGIVAGAVIYLALARMGGSFGWYLGMIVVQVALFAALTGPVVYSRLIAENFDKARGMALGIAASSYSVVGLAVVPLLTGFIERAGWRTGYDVVAAATVIAGVAVLLLIPGRKAGPNPSPAALSRGCRTDRLSRHLRQPGVLADRRRHRPVQPDDRHADDPDESDPAEYRHGFRAGFAADLGLCDGRHRRQARLRCCARPVPGAHGRDAGDGAARVRSGAAGDGAAIAARPGPRGAADRACRSAPKPTSRGFW